MADFVTVIRFDATRHGRRRCTAGAPTAQLVYEPKWTTVSDSPNFCTAPSSASALVGMTAETRQFMLGHPVNERILQHIQVSKVDES